MKDEGFLTAAGWRFVILGTLLIVGGVLAYFLVAEDISIDLESLTETSTTSSTTEFDVDGFTVPDVTVPDVDDGGASSYAECVEKADTVDAILDCTNR